MQIEIRSGGKSLQVLFLFLFNHHSKFKIMSVLSTINADDVVFLLIDHQAGLFQVVKDNNVVQLKQHVINLAKIAAFEKIPVITTASEPNGPNGPFMPEIHQIVPHAIYVPRNGEINAWDTPAFREAVKKTGRKKLVIAGILTSVCVTFPSISAKTESYEVFAAIDASGDMSELSSQATIARLTMAGVVPISSVAVISEIQKKWTAENAEVYAETYAGSMPNYQFVVESYYKAKTLGGGIKDEPKRNGKEIISKFFEAQGKQDVQGMADTLAENIVFEMPFALPGLPDRVEGKATVVEFLEQFLSKKRGIFNGWDPQNIRIYSGSDQDLYFAELDLQGMVAQSGYLYRQKYIILFRVSNGLISLWREYLNPFPLRDALVSAGQYRSEDAVRKN